MKVGVDAAFIAGELVSGDVLVEDGKISAVGLPSDGGGHIATVGFVDLQVNGYAGVDFSTADVAGYERAGAAMAAHGVTTFMPTFITLPLADYPAALAVAAAAQAVTPGMAGVHLEGPFISPHRCGAHDPANIIEPAPDLVAGLANSDVVAWTTIAPEVPGGLEAIRAFVAAGATVAVGHSNATAPSVHAAFEAGATSVTHLFNAQSALSHRAPGVPGVALDDERVLLTVIADGNHLAPEVLRLVFATAPVRTALITDAIAAAGLGDGPTRLGDRRVTVTGSVARLDDGTLAGSVVTMDAAVRGAVDAGVSLERAVAAATANPARALGDAVPADLVPGAAADVVVLDRDLGVVRTMRAGAEVHAR